MNNEQQTNPSVARQSNVAANPSQTTSNVFGIVALVTGIISFISGWLWFIAAPLGIAAVVFGILAITKKSGKGMGVAGVILGALGIVGTILITLFMAALIHTAKNYDEAKTSGQSSTSTTDSTKKATSWDVDAAYSKIQTGMTKAEVEQAVGKPSTSCSSSDSSFGSSESCSYGNVITDGHSISVTYDDGKVGWKSKY